MTTYRVFVDLPIGMLVEADTEEEAEARGDERFAAIYEALEPLVGSVFDYKAWFGARYDNTEVEEVL